MFDDIEAIIPKARIMLHAFFRMYNFKIALQKMHHVDSNMHQQFRFSFACGVEEVLTLLFSQIVFC